MKPVSIATVATILAAGEAAAHHEPASKSAPGLVVIVALAVVILAGIWAVRSLSRECRADLR